MSITRVGCHAYNIYSKRVQVCSESCSFFVADKGVEMSERVSVKYCRCLNTGKGELPKSKVMTREKWSIMHCR